MGARNTWSGRVEITPPQTWAECKLSPGVEDVKLDLHDEDGPAGKILTAIAVIPARDSDSWSAHAGEDLQAVIDAHPDHEFAGYLQVGWDPDPGSDAAPAHRYLVRGRRVVEVTSMLTWPGEDREDEVARLKAELAKYTGWEPTVKEEYEHACGQVEQVIEIVRGFKRDNTELDDTATAFVAALEKTLEVW